MNKFLIEDWAPNPDSQDTPIMDKKRKVKRKNFNNSCDDSKSNDSKDLSEEEKLNQN